MAEAQQPAARFTDLQQSQSASGAEHAAELVGDTDQVGEVAHCEPADHRVDCPGRDGELRGVGLKKGSTARTCGAEHPEREIDPDRHVASATEVAGQVPGPAADVEHDRAR